MVGSGPPEDAVRHKEREARERMATFEERCAEAGYALSRTLLRHGDPAEEVLGAVDSGGYDLLISGTHGRKGVPRLFMGSVAEELVRGARCPVLTVRVSD